MYFASDPDNVIDTVVTPFLADESRVLSSIQQDDVTKVITLTLANGESFTFNMVFNTPTSISILTTSDVILGPGSSASFEFRVNPSTALFNYDVDSDGCEIELDKVGTSRGYSSYVTDPTNYKLVKVEQVYNSVGGMKVGQYRATIQDQGISDSYKEQVALVLSVADGNNIPIQISSSAINVRSATNEFASFAFLAADNRGKISEDVEVPIAGNMSVCIPYLSDFRLVASFSTNGEAVYVDNVEQHSGKSVQDFSEPVTYKVKSADGDMRTYTVTVTNSGLPIVSINTPNAQSITSKEDWIEGATMSIVNAGVQNYEGTTSIRGRGNSTWGMPKKPYALKLDSKAEILGMPKHKRWVLLANWMDRTLMRNAVAFEIARATGLAWTPRGKFVEVVLNGEHKGTYYLCEQIKVDKNRVNITEMESTDISDDAITGGYLMELDTYFDEVNKFKSAREELPYMFKEPDEETLVTEQLEYMQKYINDLEELLYTYSRLSAHEYEEYMDVDSYIDFWFVQELADNEECWHPKSTYMHKDRGGKLTAGPVWDFDWGTFTSDAPSYTIKGALYYNRLFLDKAFKARVKERWTGLKPKFDMIPAFIEQESQRIKASADVNILMWPISSEYNKDEKMTFDEAIASMKNSYQAKLDWLDEQISKY